MGGEAQCGNIGVDCAYRKSPRQATLADWEQGDDDFLTCDIAGWFHL